MNEPLDSDLNTDWGFNGTNEIEFYNAHITSVVNSSGHLSTKDAIVGRNIIGNFRQPFAKLTDLDVDAQMHSTIYGLKFGVKWNDDFPEERDDIAFYGNWTRNVIAQSIWPRLKCYNENHHGDELFQGTLYLGAQASTLITDVDWVNFTKSDVLKQLNEATGGGNLTVRITLQYYVRNYPPFVAHNATLGYVYGVIGAPSASDTLNVPGNRAMFATGKIPLGLTFEPNDLCYQQQPSDFQPWMFTAPFEVDSSSSGRNEIHLDLSNSIPSTLNNSLRNISTLRLGVYMEKESCVLLLGSESGIPYASDHNLPITSGIYTITFDASLMDRIASSPLVVAQILESDDSRGTDRICGEFSSSHSAQVLLREFEYFVRPKGYYVNRLDRNDSPVSLQTLFVTKYGRAVPRVMVKVQRAGDTSVIPREGVVVSSSTIPTNENGLATFQFNIHDPIPPAREYAYPQCNDSSPTRTLPIDGQVYMFSFCLEQNSSFCTDVTYGITFALLAFSDVTYPSTPSWVDDVSPILSQYAQLTPIMKTILDMSSYADVTKPHNLNLLNLSLRLDFEDPSHMPATRDLSPVKRDMILRWLEHPQFDSSNSTPPPALTVCNPQLLSFARARSPEYFTPPRCSAQSLRFDGQPQENEPYFADILFSSSDSTPTDAIEGRPLFGVINDSNAAMLKCSRENITIQLQTAVQLEWATILTYLTSLYSVVDSCNVEIYNLIRSVIIQEMLHMTQSANILIAMNRVPLIDDASVTPTFPTRLPGGVLPGLEVSSKKLSLRQVYETFMAIEVPENTFVAFPPIITSNFTIGVFYGEISSCIEHLFNNSGEEIFDASTVDRQARWPWTPSEDVGTVIPITNSNSAVNAIATIIAQGEGAGLLNPNDIDSNVLAHFFKFEEIVCQRHLQKIDEVFYAFSGARIPFQSEGVWPMRDNPTVANVPQDTNCYTESRVFHNTYRKLLKKLQEVFSGNPDAIFEAVELMESLQVHAKVLMWTKFNPESPTDDTTCGPVWEYDWPLPAPNITQPILARVDSSAPANHAMVAHLGSIALAFGFILY